MDTHCVDEKCVPWAETCQVADTSCAVDLTLGRPCVALDNPEATFHIPVCNRGQKRLDTGTIRIGVDSRAQSINQCTSGLPTDFPDAGQVIYTLSKTDGKVIEPGHCIDVNSGNSSQSGLVLTDNRALVVDYESEIPECNRCNNSNIVVPVTKDGGGSLCIACSNLDCEQTNPKTTLQGTVFDPAGRVPVPNVWVYIPNRDVAQLSNTLSASCDTCTAMISGAPIAIVRSDATGHFELKNVPVDVKFPLVVQTGRWRRQFVIDEVSSGVTRWVESCTADRSVTGNASGNCRVTAQEPVAVEEGNRLRLPRTQRRCLGQVCGGEGDIPKMALIMGDADPVQCLLRRIGVAESEMTSSSGNGQIHLFNHNGMQIDAGQNGFGPGGLLENREQLNRYAALLTPCDYKHDTVFGSETDSYRRSLQRSGPSYNSPPDPTSTPIERSNVKAYVDAGGRLFATHWLSMDFIHLNYSAPPAFVASAENPAPMLVPFDPATLSLPVAVESGLDSLGFSWENRPLDTFNPEAPTIHLFGRPIELAGNVGDPRPPTFSPIYPHFDYTIDVTNPAGQALATWADAVGASPAGSPGTLRFQSWSTMVRAVRGELGVSRLAYGDATERARFYYGGTAPALVPRPQQPCVMYGTSNDNPYNCYTYGKIWGDEHVALYEFDTPLKSEEKCGRVVAAQTHATKHACSMPSVQPRSCRSDGSSTDCNCVTLPDAREWVRGCGDEADALNPLSPEELAFEYLLFSTTQCLGDTVVPTRVVSLPQRSYERIFEADCESTEHAQWRTFSLQATIPAGTSVSVSAQTADHEKELRDGKVESVDVGTFTESTSTWTTSEHTLDTYFRKNLNPPDVSRRWLKLRLTLTPKGDVSPIISQWRVIFNCVPAE
jgi:hypothetical protein